MDNLGTEWLTFTLLTRFGGGGGGLLTLGWEGGEGTVGQNHTASAPPWRSVKSSPFWVVGGSGLGVARFKLTVN